MKTVINVTENPKLPKKFKDEVDHYKAMVDVAFEITEAARIYYWAQRAVKLRAKLEKGNGLNVSREMRSLNSKAGHARRRLLKLIETKDI